MQKNGYCLLLSSNVQFCTLMYVFVHSLKIYKKIYVYILLVFALFVKAGSLLCFDRSFILLLYWFNFFLLIVIFIY